MTQRYLHCVHCYIQTCFVSAASFLVKFLRRKVLSEFGHVWTSQGYFPRERSSFPQTAEYLQGLQERCELMRRWSCLEASFGSFLYRLTPSNRFWWPSWDFTHVSYLCKTSKARTRAVTRRNGEEPLPLCVSDRYARGGDWNLIHTTTRSCVEFGLRVVHNTHCHVVAREVLTANLKSLRGFWGTTPTEYPATRACDPCFLLTTGVVININILSVLVLFWNIWRWSYILYNYSRPLITRTHTPVSELGTQARCQHHGAPLSDRHSVTSLGSGHPHHWPCYHHHQKFQLCLITAMNCHFSEQIFRGGGGHRT